MMPLALFDAVFLVCFAIVFLAVARQVLRSQAHGQPVVNQRHVNMSDFQHQPLTFAINGPRSLATMGQCPAASAADLAEAETLRALNFPVVQQV